MPPSVGGQSTIASQVTQPVQSHNQQHYQQAPAPPPPAHYNAPPPVPQYPRARALYPFQTQNPNELPFNPGDILNLLNTDGAWWQAELNGRTGLIPSNYVERI